MSSRHQPENGADSDTGPHWACPDCGEPCRCTDYPARLMPHERCGRNDAATEAAAPKPATRLPEGESSLAGPSAMTGKP